MRRPVISIVLLGVTTLVVGLLMSMRREGDAEIATAQSEKPSAEDFRSSKIERSGASSHSPLQPAPETPAPTNLFAQIEAGDVPSLSVEQAEAFLTANKRTAESLLAVYRAAHDKTYLREAQEKFPDDPKVNFAGYFDALYYSKDEYTTEQRRALLDRFAKSAPENSLANYLAASDYFKSGESDQAVEQFRSATTKSTLQDYSLEFIQNYEEAFRSAGYSEADANVIAMSTLILPHLSQLKQAGVKLLELADQHQKSANEAQAGEARQMALHLAGLLQDGSQQKFVINQLVGLAVERKLLSALDPQSAYDNAGQTVQNRIDKLIQTRKDLQTNLGPLDGLLPRMTPADQVAYFDRVRISGEASASKWAVDKYGH